MKFATEYIIWTEEQWDCVYFSKESKFKQMVEGLFDAVRRSDICLSALKAVLNLKEEVW